jgi:hypothetical protein
MPIPEIAAAIASARTIGEIFKGLVALNTDSKVQVAIIDAQNLVLDLQGKMFEIHDRFEQQATELSELRAKLKEKEDWDLTASKYELFQATHTTFAYRLKNPQTPVERGAEFCAFCFGNKKIVLLQNRYCHGCGQ